MIYIIGNYNNELLETSLILLNLKYKIINNTEDFIEELSQLNDYTDKSNIIIKNSKLINKKINKNID